MAGVLRRGDRGPAVAQVWARLAGLGLVQPAKSDIFDDQLESAVRQFQQERGMTVDGIVGPHTQRRLEEARWALGDRVLTYTPGRLTFGDDVASLQQKLMELGFSIDRVDGLFGPVTDAALREFQRNIGVTPDGICGPEVFHAIGQLVRTVAGGSQERLRDLGSRDWRVRHVEPLSVLIDPSGQDRPIRDSKLTEADICWDVASRLEGRLAVAGLTTSHSYARTSAEPDQRDRATTANESGCDLFVAIRLASYRDPRAQGSASYYFGHEWSHSPTGARLAGLIQEEISTATALLDGKSHGKTWDLLRLTRMPAVQVELGYATNEQDSALLAQPEVRDQLAAALARSIRRLSAPRIG